MLRTLLAVMNRQNSFLKQKIEYLITVSSSFAFILTEICTPGYCLNGGICKPVGNIQTCICQTGFYGDRCEKKKGE